MNKSFVQSEILLNTSVENTTDCFFHCQRHRYWELTLLFPIRSTIVLTALVCLVVLFRRCPGATIGIISGCVATLGLWLLLLSELGKPIPKYE